MHGELKLTVTWSTCTTSLGNGVLVTDLLACSSRDLLRAVSHSCLRVLAHSVREGREKCHEAPTNIRCLFQGGLERLDIGV